MEQPWAVTLRHGLRHRLERAVEVVVRYHDHVRLAFPGEHFEKRQRMYTWEDRRRDSMLDPGLHLLLVDGPILHTELR